MLNELRQQPVTHERKMMHLKDPGCSHWRAKSRLQAYVNGLRLGQSFCLRHIRRHLAALQHEATLTGHGRNVTQAWGHYGQVQSSDWR